MNIWKLCSNLIFLPKLVGTPCTTDPTAHLSSPLNMGNFNNCKKSLRIRCKSSFGFGTTATNAHLDNHLFLATFWLDVTTCEFFLKQMLIKSSNQSIAITHARHGWVYFLKRCNLDLKNWVDSVLLNISSLRSLISKWHHLCLWCLITYANNTKFVFLDLESYW